MLTKFYKNDRIELITHDKIKFVDQGEYFENVSCNFCEHNIKTEDWQTAMENAYKMHFADLTFIIPCCNKETSLNDLNYKWPAGFSKFVISVPDAQKEITEKDLRELQGILGTTLRIIRARY